MERWTPQEVEDLIKLYNKLDNEALMKHFNRTYLSIYKKARSLNLYKTTEMEFINRSKARQGEKASNWKGGKKKSSGGYVLILDKRHPRSKSNGGYVFEHTLIMEKHIGRFLREGEVVHHINKIKDDNRIENLKLMSYGEHVRLHHLGSKRSLKTREKIREKAKQRYKHIKKRSVINE